MTIDRSIQQAYRNRAFEAKALLLSALPYDAHEIVSYLYRRRKSVLRFEDGQITLNSQPSPMLTWAFHDAPIELTEAARMLGLAIVC